MLLYSLFSSVSKITNIAIHQAVQSIQSEEIKAAASRRQRKLVLMVISNKEPLLLSVNNMLLSQVMLLAGTFILCWTPYAVLAVMAILGTLIILTLTGEGGRWWWVAGWLVGLVIF